MPAPDERGARSLRLLPLIPGMLPAGLEPADASVLVAVLCWSDGWPHGGDSVRQACNTPQRAQAAGSRPVDVLAGWLAAKAPRSGVEDAY